MTMIEERITMCYRKHPGWDAQRIQGAIAGSNIAQVREIMGGAVPPGETIYPGHPKADPEPATPAPPSGGFSLRGVRLLSKKPADCMKARLCALRKGMGYKIESLSKDWGISADTIRKHAKDHHALVYVEATPGEYVACVVHPETQKGE